MRLFVLAALVLALPIVGMALTDSTANVRTVRRASVQRTVFGVFAVVFVSLLFGVCDERLTRLSGTLGQLANSPIAWGVWPCVVGLAIGGLMRGAIGGAIATPVALGSFYVAHTDDLGQSVNGMDAWLGVGLAVGLVAGGIGGAVRRLLGHFQQPKWWKFESSD